MKHILENNKTNRKSTYDINPLILHRWSPRAMTGETISDSDLMALFEAARWAPSSYNDQPWRFIYAKRGTKYWDSLFSLLVEFNQEWAKNASALIVIVARKTFEDSDEVSTTSQFDTGASWQNLALEASFRGFVAHGMGGFDYDKAKTVLNIPDNYEVLAMAAIGKQASKDVLPEHLQKSEFPSERKVLGDIVMEGTFRH